MGLRTMNDSLDSLVTRALPDYDLNYQSYGDFNFPLVSEPEVDSKPSSGLPFELAFAIMNGSGSSNHTTLRWRSSSLT